MQANNEISVLHLTNDIGVSATVYCCFQLSMCLAGPII